MLTQSETDTLFAMPKKPKSSGFSHFLMGRDYDENEP
jgi:hypothetical protein